MKARWAFGSFTGQGHISGQGQINMFFSVKGTLCANLYIICCQICKLLLVLKFCLANQYRSFVWPTNIKVLFGQPILKFCLAFQWHFYFLYNIQTHSTLVTHINPYSLCIHCTLTATGSTATMRALNTRICTRLVPGSAIAPNFCSPNNDKPEKNNNQVHLIAILIIML